MVGRMKLLGEEEYQDQMTHMVRPLLDEKRKSGYFQSFDGTRIYYETYINSREKAAIVISHGFCEFTKKFEEVIFYFYQAGYSVYIPDHRGHGYSQRTVEDLSKVSINSYDEYVKDFHSFITTIVYPDQGHKKLILYAHSMGGAIAALYLEQYQDIFSCAILSSPMLEINCGGIPLPIVHLVTLYKKLIHSDTEYVTGHQAFDGIPQFETSCCLSEARYNYIFSWRLQDENYQTYGASYAWTRASLKAVHKLQRHVKLVKTPILLFQAGNDSTVKPGGQRRFAKRAENVKLVVLSDSKHEIYNAKEAIREEYYHRLFDFIEEHL